MADALKQPRDVAAAAPTRLVDARLLDSAGSLTALGREQLTQCRQRVSQTTQTLAAGIDPAAIQTTLGTLDTVRTRAEQQFASRRSPGAAEYVRP